MKVPMVGWEDDSLIHNRGGWVGDQRLEVICRPTRQWRRQCPSGCWLMSIWLFFADHIDGIDRHAQWTGRQKLASGVQARAG